MSDAPPQDNSGQDATAIVVEGPNVQPATPDQTVVVEDQGTDPNEALDFSDRVNRIVDERVAQSMASLRTDIMSVVESVRATPEPEPKVVVVAPEPKPEPVTEPAPAPDPTPDESPPQDHWYFKPRGKKGKRT